MKVFSKTKGLYYSILSTITILFLISSPGAGLGGTLIEDQSIDAYPDRTYHLYVPAELPESSVPILFILHGGTSNADQIIGLPGNAAPAKVFLELADIDKFIVVIPNGVADTDPESRHWNDCRGDCAPNGDADDVGFIEALIDQVKYDYPAVDLDRVYCKGVSNGGLMCLRLARELSDQIAAIAATSAANATFNICADITGDEYISIMMINGTDDPILPWDGGLVAAGLDPHHGTTDSVADTIAFWASHNNTEEFNITDIPDIDKSDKSTVSKETYGNGEEGTEVILYRVNGGGHPVPSIQERFSWLYQRRLVGWQNHDIETAVEVWAFFQKHGLNGPVSCDESVEICDGIDNDCDGEIDEGLPVSTYYRDADGDTFGDPYDSTNACSQPDGYVTNSTDCDDSNSEIYLGATETCDGKDNDCDGTADEELTRATSCGLGACFGNTGIETCTEGLWDGDSDTCDPLAGAVAEICDDEIDNDCDGGIDEGCGDPCLLIGETCSSDSDCCSGKCKGRAGRKTCK